MPVSISVVGVFQGDKGRTPLYYALLQGSAPMVRLLLQFAARVDINLKGDAEVGFPPRIIAMFSLSTLFL